MITNVASDDTFKMDYVVTDWKILHVEKLCYLVGVMENKLVVVTLKTNEDKTGLLQKSYTIGEQKVVRIFSLNA